LKNETKLVSVLERHAKGTPPIWLMRQAGRYLPEYRAARERYSSFWDMCMDPKIAAEITLQPIRRFGFDAAIIFSDIMVVPAALGIDVVFEEGVGPRMQVISAAEELLDEKIRWSEKTGPVYDALSLVHAKLPADTALIGFAGGAWTLATYLAEGRGSRDQQRARLWGYSEPASFERLLARLSSAVARHLSSQIDAGASVVQIFDSWASGLPRTAFSNWVIEPTRRIVEHVRAQHPRAKVIGFPRGATQGGYLSYAKETGVDAVSLDSAVSMSWASEVLAGHAVIQGNLDPVALLAGGEALAEAAEEILKSTETIPHLFNLGHGILPETPLAHVEKLLSLVRSR